MPYIELQSPDGYGYRISTRNPDTLRAWLDEILPHTFCEGRPGIDDFDVLWPKVNVYPMFWESDGRDADWLVDSRVLGRLLPLEARTGEEGLAALARIKAELAKELEDMRP